MGIVSIVTDPWILLFMCLSGNLLLCSRLFYVSRKLDKIENMVSISKEELYVLKSRLENIKRAK